MQLIQLQKQLRRLDLIIFTLNDVVKITGQKKEIVKVFLSNQVAKNKIYSPLFNDCKKRIFDMVKQ